MRDASSSLRLLKAHCYSRVYSTEKVVLSPRPRPGCPHSISHPIVFVVLMLSTGSSEHHPVYCHHDLAYYLRRQWQRKKPRRRTLVLKGRFLTANWSKIAAVSYPTRNSLLSPAQNGCQCSDSFQEEERREERMKTSVTSMPCCASHAGTAWQAEFQQQDLACNYNFGG